MTSDHHLAGEIDCRVTELKEQLSHAQHNLADVPQEIFLLLQLGNAYHDKGELQKAFAYRRAAFDTAAGYGGTLPDELVILLHGDLGRSYLEANQHSEAEQCSGRAVELAERIGNEEGAVVYRINLQSAIFAMGRQQEADQLTETTLRRALRLANPYLLGLLFANLAVQASAIGRLNMAQSYARQALYWAKELEPSEPVAARQLRLVAESAISSSYHAGGLMTGRDEYLEAADKSRSVALDGGSDEAAGHTAVTEAQRAGLEVIAGHYAKAMSHSERAVAALETVRRGLGYPHMQLSFFEHSRSTYDTAIELMLRLGAASVAFHTAERARNRLALAQLHSAPAGVSTWPDEALSELTETLDRYGAAQRGRDHAGRQASSRRFLQLYRDNVDERPQWMPWQSPSPAQAIEAQQILGDDQAILSYYVTRQSTMVFTVTREACHFQQLALSEEKLAGYIAELRAAFADLESELDADEVDLLWDSRNQPADPWPPGLTRALEVLNDWLQQMFAVLVAPVLPAVENKTHWMIVPHGPLHQMPWSALRSDGRYLIQDKTLGYLPSVSLAVAMHRDPRPPTESGPALLFVDTDSLTQAREEAAAAQHEMPEAKAFFGEEATAAAFLQKAPTARLLHLICHHSVDADVPGLAHFRLSGTRGSDYLYAFQVNELRLVADLVVMSCCATGHAKVLTGDEQFGMVQAFLATGARSTIATLWDVYDEASAEFFRIFYKHCREGSAVVAMAQAQRELIEHPQLCLPLFWAPYLLFGEGDTHLGANTAAPDKRG